LRKAHESKNGENDHRNFREHRIIPSLKGPRPINGLQRKTELFAAEVARGEVKRSSLNDFIAAPTHFQTVERARSTSESGRSMRNPSTSRLPMTAAAWRRPSGGRRLTRSTPPDATKARPALGLHVVYNIVTHRLGGKVTLESAPSQGTRCQLILPKIAPP
jgi:hypothetical protein